MKQKNKNTLSIFSFLLVFISGFIIGGIIFSNEVKISKIKHHTQTNNCNEQIAKCEEEKENYRIIVDDYVAVGLCDEDCCKTCANR